mgnify:CR=1 FL=1
MSVDKFWSNDFTVLFDKNKLSHFYPKSNMSMSEILNSLVRASVYLSVCLFIYKRNTNVFFIVIGTMVLTYISRGSACGTDIVDIFSLCPPAFVSRTYVAIT